MFEVNKKLELYKNHAEYTVTVSADLDSVTRVSNVVEMELSRILNEQLDEPREELVSDEDEEELEEDELLDDPEEEDEEEEKAPAGDTTESFSGRPRTHKCKNCGADIYNPSFGWFHSRDGMYSCSGRPGGVDMPQAEPKPETTPTPKPVPSVTPKAQKWEGICKNCGKEIYKTYEKGQWLHKAVRLAADSYSCSGVQGGTVLPLAEPKEIPEWANGTAQICKHCGKQIYQSTDSKWYHNHNYNDYCVPGTGTDLAEPRS